MPAPTPLSAQELCEHSLQYGSGYITRPELFVEICKTLNQCMPAAEKEILSLKEDVDAASNQWKESTLVQEGEFTVEYTDPQQDLPVNCTDKTLLVTDRVPNLGEVLKKFTDAGGERFCVVITSKDLEGDSHNLCEPDYAETHAKGERTLLMTQVQKLATAGKIWLPIGGGLGDGQAQNTTYLVLYGTWPKELKKLGQRNRRVKPSVLDAPKEKPAVLDNVASESTVKSRRVRKKEARIDKSAPQLAATFPQADPAEQSESKDDDVGLNSPLGGNYSSILSSLPQRSRAGKHEEPEFPKAVSESKADSRWCENELDSPEAPNVSNNLENLTENLRQFVDPRAVGSVPSHFESAFLNETHDALALLDAFCKDFEEKIVELLKKEKATPEEATKPEFLIGLVERMAKFLVLMGPHLKDPSFSIETSDLPPKFFDLITKISQKQPDREKRLRSFVSLAGHIGHLLEDVPLKNILIPRAAGKCIELKNSLFEMHLTCTGLREHFYPEGRIRVRRGMLITVYQSIFGMAPATRKDRRKKLSSQRQIKQNCL